MDLTKGKIEAHSIIIILAWLVILAGGVFLGFRIYNINQSINTGEPKELDFVEVQEYEGKDLSSINDFRENSIKGPQYIDKATYKLEITGLVENPQSLSYDDVINNHQSYKKVVALNCVEGWSVNILWEGVLVKELVQEAGILPEAKIVIFHAYDGYTTSFPLEYLLDNNILMAYKMNGGTIIPERGFPFQLVAETKLGYKWIKWITGIELSDDTEYKGYWESRGYSNDGNLDEFFLNH